MTALFDWIPPQRLLGLSFWSPQLFTACAPLVILCCLSLFKRWARLTDSPIVFALVYAAPFFLLTFQDSLGDSIQMMGGIHKRYYMSEPGTTWVNYWIFRFLHEPFNIGAKSAIALSSRLAGLAYLWLVARNSILLFPDQSASRRLVYRLMFFTAGVTLLFYGYVENTPLAVAGEQLWVLASIVFLQTPSFPHLFECGAALALATAFHGRAAFLAPAFILGCCIPSGSVGTRMKRAAAGGTVYFGLLALMVAYILLFDYQNISDGVFGNALGGGNRRMFVPLRLIFDKSHWLPILAALFIAGGVLSPCGLFAAVRALFKRQPLLLWALAYLLADIVYVLLWEFDFGPFLDWDLVFSAVGPFLLLASIAVTRSRVPVFLLLPFLLASAILSMAFATILNGGPLALTVIPRAASPVAASVCAHPGLRRTYFSDSQLRMPLGPSEPDLPNHAYGPDTMPFPTHGKPLGGVFEGYIKIPSPGRYRFFILAQGNLRFMIANHTLFERWTGFEWRITSEREMRFSEAGWYPIRLEFFSKVQDFAVKLEVESAGQERRAISMNDLCYK
jgi:hypothetical protein